jgi:hypothetical protein
MRAPRPTGTGALHLTAFPGDDYRRGNSSKGNGGSTARRQDYLRHENKDAQRSFQRMGILNVDLFLISTIIGNYLISKHTHPRLQ